MLTGMRRDEVRDLQWEQVAWRQKVLRLPDSKTGKRDVVVSDEVMALLGEIAAARGNPRRGLVVCSKRGKKLYSLDRSWGHARKLAGLPDVRLHDLRHSVASDAIMNGVPPSSLQPPANSATAAKRTPIPRSPSRGILPTLRG